MPNHPTIPNEAQTRALRAFAPSRESFSLIAVRTDGLKLFTRRREGAKKKLRSWAPAFAGVTV
jgi:hypothetical protein